MVSHERCSLRRLELREQVARAQTQRSRMSLRCGVVSSRHSLPCRRPRGTSAGSERSRGTLVAGSASSSDTRRRAPLTRRLLPRLRLRHLRATACESRLRSPASTRSAAASRRRSLLCSRPLRAREGYVWCPRWLAWIRN